MRSYIGVTDAESSDWVRARLRAYLDAGGGEIGRHLHIGVMMSRKSLRGLPTKYAAVWPKNDGIARIFVKHPLILNVLHYADYDGTTTQEDFARAVDFGGPRLDAFQLDMPWPDPRLVRSLRQRRSRLRIILQVGGQALRQIGDDPDLMIERLRTYGGSIDDVLLDKSMGQGRGLDAEGLRPFVEALRGRFPALGVAVAGGLGPDTLHLVAPLVRDFPDISIDAQGQLRPSGSSLDPIDAQRADGYLRGAVQMFRR